MAKKPQLDPEEKAYREYREALFKRRARSNGWTNFFGVILFVVLGTCVLVGRVVG